MTLLLVILAGLTLFTLGYALGYAHGNERGTERTYQRVAEWSERRGR